MALLNKATLGRWEAVTPNRKMEQWGLNSICILFVTGLCSYLLKISTMKTFITRRLVTSALLSFSLALTACSDSETSVPTAPTPLIGHVSNDDGPILSARIEAKDAKGQIVAKTELQAGSNRYQLTLPVGTAFPVVLSAYPQGENQEVLKAAVASPLAAEQDISPVSTMVVDTALNLGGITEANLAKAAGAAISMRKKSGGGGGGGAGATTESFKGDPTKQYGGWH